MILRMLIIILILSVPLAGQEYSIPDFSLFGCQNDEDKDSLLYNYVVVEIDSITKAETIRGNGKDFRVKDSFSFTELKCIKYYEFRDEHDFHYRNMEQYYKVLFNVCDSTLYPFSGDGLKFTNVIKSYLPEIIAGGEQKILNLCFLFLHTVNRVPINSIDNYQKLWEDIYEEYSDYNELSEEDIIDDIESINRLLHPTSTYTTNRITYKNNFFRIIIKTWEPFNGDIESWTLLVSNKIFEVENVTRRLERMGPYQQRHSDLIIRKEN